MEVLKRVDVVGFLRYRIDRWVLLWGALPALSLAHWTRHRRLLTARVWAQALLAFGLTVALPASVLVQLLALACLPGLAAAREFAAVGRGTPLPYDPPERLVTSGPYAYVRNPMQLSMVLVYLMLGLVHPALSIGAVICLAYGAGFASWHEGGRLREDCGAAWTEYRAGVRPWLPRWRPWSGRAEGTLYVAMDCGMCRGVGNWVAVRRPTALRMGPAADHPEVLYRLTYETADGARWSGLAAVARAMEHLHLGWALTGWALSLPVVRHFLQLCADAFGTGPRPSRKGPTAHVPGEPRAVMLVPGRPRTGPQPDSDAPT